MIVKDLDILRPEKKIIKLNGKEIDVSFVPCGSTFEIDRIMRELRTIDNSKLADGQEDTKKAFDLTIDMCVAFCEHKFPEMNKQWFLDNADVNQIKVFSEAIQEALVAAYNGAESDSKNVKAAKKKSQ